MTDRTLEAVTDAIAAVDGVDPLPRHEAMAQAAIDVMAEGMDDCEDADPWRDLALQFDANRIEARTILLAVSEGRDVRHLAEAFLRRPPLAGEEVLAQRLAEIAEGRG